MPGDNLIKSIAGLFKVKRFLIKKKYFPFLEAVQKLNYLSRF
jgi:hypothetical protein